jgi:hypothetical protein
MMHTDACIDEILKHGLDDWIQAAEVASIIMSIAGLSAFSDVRCASLVAIGRILHEELMVAGDVTVDGFNAWTMTPTQAFDAISREWSSLGRLPSLGEVCWLSNTPKGDARAQSTP